MALKMAIRECAPAHWWIRGHEVAGAFATHSTAARATYKVVLGLPLVRASMVLRAICKMLRITCHLWMWGEESRVPFLLLRLSLHASSQAPQ